MTLQPLVMSVAVDLTSAPAGGHVGYQDDDSACVCCGGVIGVLSTAAMRRSAFYVAWCGISSGQTLMRKRASSGCRR